MNGGKIYLITKIWIFNIGYNFIIKKKFTLSRWKAIPFKYHVSEKRHVPSRNNVYFGA